MCSLVLFLWACSAAADPYTALRESMVQRQIEGRGIHNAAVLRVMRETPRHLFVPEEVRAQAYEDHPLPIGSGATISQPYIVANMTELLEVSSKHRVLEIGTGSGYQAAVLSRLAGKVYSIELESELAARATGTLKRLGYSNVIVKQGDGYSGWPSEAPFDRILLTAAPAEIPTVLIDQLAEDGRLVAPVGKTSFQELIVIEKRKGKIRRSSAGYVTFVPLRHP